MRTKTKIKKISILMLNFLTKLLALGLFSGKIPKISGTAGSFVAIILSVFFVKIPILQQIVILILLTFFGTLSIDEIVAVLFICLLAQYITPANTMDVRHFVSIFVLFRVFDISKPYPICVVDKKMKNPIGIMLDDLLAGLASWLFYICLFA